MIAVKDIFRIHGYYFFNFGKDSEGTSTDFLVKSSRSSKRQGYHRTHQQCDVSEHTHLERQHH